MADLKPHYTLVCPRAPAAFTNEWNNLSGVDWSSQVRGAFESQVSACEWARDHLIHGAPFTIKYVSVADDLDFDGEGYRAHLASLSDEMVLSERDFWRDASSDDRFLSLAWMYSVALDVCLSRGLK